MDAMTYEVPEEDQTVAETPVSVDSTDGGMALLVQFEDADADLEKRSTVLATALANPALYVEMAARGVGKTMVSWSASVDNAAPDSDAAVAQLLAEMAKQEHARLWLSDVLPLCFAILGRHEPQHAASFHAMRAIGNLCYDCQPNRNAIVESAAAPVAAYLKAASTHLACRVGAGAVLNLSMDHEGLQERLTSEGVVEKLTQLVANSKTDDGDDDDNEAVHDMAFSAIGALLKNHSPARVRASANEAFLLHLLSLVCTVPVEMDNNVDESDGGTAADMLKAIAEDEASSHGFAPVVERILTCALQQDVDQASPLQTRQVHLANLIAVLSAEPACVTLLGTKRLIDSVATTWCHADSPLQMAGCLVVGNVARSDALAIQIVKNHPSLVAALKTCATHSDARIQHAALGSMRNLIVCKENRPVMRDMLSSLLPLLSSMHEAIRYLGASIARLLGATDAEGATVLSQDTALVRELARAARSIEKRGQSTEACRALAGLMRYAPSAELLELICAKATDDEKDEEEEEEGEEEEGGRPAAADWSKNSTPAAMVRMLLRSNLELLLNEAVSALTVCAAALGVACLRPFAAADVLSALASVLENDRASPEIRHNVALLSDMLITVAHEQKDFASNDHVSALKLSLASFRAQSEK